MIDKSVATIIITVASGKFDMPIFPVEFTTVLVSVVEVDEYSFSSEAKATTIKFYT